MENAYYEGPLRVRVPVNMQLDADGAFSFDVPLPSPEGALGEVSHPLVGLYFGLGEFGGASFCGVLLHSLQEPGERSCNCFLPGHACLPTAPARRHLPVTCLSVTWHTLLSASAVHGWDQGQACALPPASPAPCYQLDPSHG